MSLDQINDYGPGDNNFTSFQETLDATRRGMAEITLSNYDNDSAPVVKVGSVFENNGAFFQVTTSDITPTGYSGISNSTTFYLYFDESATAFIYSSTAPTWNDARQGWYNSDDRALFSMYKDSGGTLYQNKTLIQQASDYRTVVYNNISYDGVLNPSLNTEFISQTIAAGGNYILPRGAYFYYYIARTFLQVNMGGTWRTISGQGTSPNDADSRGCFAFSDGANVRILNADGAVSRTAELLRF